MNGGGRARRCGVRPLRCVRALSHLQDEEGLREARQLRKVDLITQVKQLQENLSRMVRSMKVQNIGTEEAPSQEPRDSPPVAEDGLSDSGSDGEGSGPPPPDGALGVSAITWGLTGVFGNQLSWLSYEMPSVPPEEKADLRGASLCSHVSSRGSTRDLTYSGGPGPLRDALGAGDLSSWSSPEVVRKDSTLELLPSLPVTPRSDALSQRSLDTSLGDQRSSSLLQADPWGLLGSPDGSAAVKAPCWTETPLATDRTLSADHHVQHMTVVGGVPQGLPWGGVHMVPGPQCVPVGLCLCGSWCHSGSHCWLTSCQACGCGRAPHSPLVSCVGTASFLHQWMLPTHCNMNI